MEAARPAVDFALVIPTLNEAGNLPIVLDRAQRALGELPDLRYELLIVDDGSRDGTQAIAQSKAAADPRIRLLERKDERGLAGAILHGWSRTRASILGVMDADLQHPPELLPRLVRTALSGVDLVVASRYLRKNSMEGWSKARLFVSRVSTWLARPFLGRVQIKDPLSGFFLLHRECIDGVTLQPEGFKLLLEIIAKARIRSSAEIPFTFGVRRLGESKASARVALDYMLLLGRLSRRSLGRTGTE